MLAGEVGMSWRLGVVGIAPVLALCSCAARPAAPAQEPSGPLARQEPLQPLAGHSPFGPTSAPTAEADAGTRLSLLRRGGADAGAPDATPASQPASLQVPSTGVQACDVYLQRYIACIQDKVPAKTRDMLQRSLMTMADAWRKVAATPAGRKSLAQACQAAMQAAKKSMKAFGCKW